MGENSLIAWTEHTYNPWIGCTKVGNGCIGCYAEAYDTRFLKHGQDSHWGPGAPRRRTSLQTRNQPIRWNRLAEAHRIPAKVFAHSLSDVFDNEVPQEWRDEEFQMWRRTPWLRWIVLTKRPGNIYDMLPKDWSPTTYPNVGFCCSVSTQDEFDRDVAKLVNQVDAAWLGVSIEPQIEEIRIPYGSPRSIQWIITGGASAQPGYVPPPYDVGWARSLISQCHDSKIACFVKQLGSVPVSREWIFPLKDKAGADPSEWPADVRVRDFPENLVR
jgi:protein gp37